MNKIRPTLLAIAVVILAMGISYYWVQRDKPVRPEQVDE